MLVSYDAFNSGCTKWQKNPAFFVMNFIKIPRNYNFTKMLMKTQYTCDLCVIWHNQPCDMCIHLHTINRRDGIMRSYISFCAKSASISLVDISVNIVVSKTYFRQKFQIELEFICAEFHIFSTISKHDIAILVSISHGNRSLTPCAWTEYRHDDVIKWKHFPRYWPLCGEFTGHRWIPSKKASDAELWCFLWSAPE